MRSHIWFGFVAIAAYATILVGGGIAHAITTPSLRCEAGKLVLTGRYALCRQNAAADLATDGDSAKYTERLLKCDYTFHRKWVRLDTDTIIAGGSCPDGGVDAGALESSIDACTADVAAVLAGSRYVDNGDGTITDHQTGLQWEQKIGTPGAVVDCSSTPCANPHDVNNVYVWSNSGTAADGAAFADFLSTLNACTDGTNGISPPTVLAGGFAGHCDWRVPTVVELETLMLAQYPCAIHPCLDSIFTPTGTAASYWSSTTRATAPTIAWAIFFGDGFITFEDDKTAKKYYVRAVRNAS